MKILHLIDSLDRGGAETLLMSYIPLLNMHEHIVVTLRGPNVFKKTNYEYIDLDLGSRKDIFKAAFAIRKIIAEKKISLVHTHSFWTNIISRVATPGKMKLINHYHFADYDTMKHKTSVKRMILLDKLVKHRGLIRVAVSEYVAKILKNTFPKAQVNVIPNFINCVSNTVANKPLDNADLKVVAVGNCNKEKNYEFLLEVFEALKNEPICIDIIGGGSQLNFYRNEVKRLGLAKVKFCGSIPNVREMLVNYNLFLSASISETFGLAILEGACAQLPLLISNIPAFNEIAPNSTVFFNPYDTKDLITKLKNFTTAHRIVDHADYESVLQKYSAAAFLSKLENLYNN